MAYQVLARKYRPQKFADVSGQEHVTRTLLNALSQGRTAHGYIFSGHRGIGKTTIARILAMALNCRTAIGEPGRPSPEPCGACVSCQEIRGGNAVDMIEIDAATNRGIDEIRELRDAARYSPARDRYKIFLLDEAHQITDAAFNGLLKTLEEPPEHVVFMMATTQPEDIPQTIRSRCQHFSFHAVNFDDIVAQLRHISHLENIEADDSALAQLAEAGDGSMRDALSIMDQAIATAEISDGKPHLQATQIQELLGAVPNTVIERLLEQVHEQNSAAMLEDLGRLLDAGNHPSQIARQIVRYLRNSLMAKIGGEKTALLQISQDERSRAARTAERFSEEDLTRFLQVMLRTFDELNYRQEQRFHLELGLLKLAHLERLIPLEQILAALPGLPPTPVSRTGIAASGMKGSGTAETRDLVSKAFGSSGGGLEDSTGGRQKQSPSSPPMGVEAAAPLSSMAPQLQGSRLNQPSSPAPSSLGAGGGPGQDDIAPAPEPAATIWPGNPPEIWGASPAAAARQDSTGPRIETSGIENRGATALSAREPVSQPAPGDLDRARATAVAALEQSKHGTAAGLLGAGSWSLESDSVLRIEVGVKKTMMSLALSNEAMRIVREALAAMGMKQKILLVPGERSDAAPPARPLSAEASNIQAEALQNPLVLQTMELFRAEVRSVVDLRESPPNVHGKR